MSEERLVPEIRFGGFEGEWEKVSFGELGSIAMCKRIYKNETSTNYEIPFYKIGTFGKKADTFISLETYKKYKNLYSFPSVGDVLISAAGTIGRTVVYDGEPSYFQDSNIIWLNHKEDKVLNEYLKHYYEIVEWDGIEGSTIKRLYNDIFLNSKVYKPGIEEQDVLAKTLTNLDNIIVSKQKEVKKYQKLKQTMLQKMFPKDGETVPEVRFDSFEAEWKEIEIGTLGEVVTGNTPSTNEKENYSARGVLWVTPTDIEKNITFKTNKMLSEIGLSKARTVPAGSILVTSIASIGKNTLVLEKAGFNQQINAVVPKKNFNSYFLLTLSNHWSKAMKKIAGAGTMDIVNRSEFTKVITLVPSYKEQNSIGEYFYELDKNIEIKQSELDKLKQFKQAMLDKMFV